MQQRLDDMEQTLTRLNGGIETAIHDLDTPSPQHRPGQHRPGPGAALPRRPHRQARKPGLGGPGRPRLGDAGTLPVGAPRPAAADHGDRAPWAPTLFAPPPPPTPAQAFQSARAALASGDPAGAATGFQDFITRYPNDARTPEAYYWLGESFYQRKGYTNATAAYASALRPRPRRPGVRPPWRGWPSR